jgi:hypothetical protein
MYYILSYFSNNDLLEFDLALTYFIPEHTQYMMPFILWKLIRANYIKSLKVLL